MSETIKKQLILIYDGDPWYGSSIKKVLKSVSPVMVYDSPESGMHSIAGLLSHIISWREFAEQVLKGKAEHPPKQEESFNWKNFSSDKEIAWDIMMNQLDSNQQFLVSAMENYTDDLLLKQKVTGKPYTYHYMLTGIVQHDLYHLGQIVYIRGLLT